MLGVLEPAAEDEDPAELDPFLPAEELAEELAEPLAVAVPFDDCPVPVEPVEAALWPVPESGCIAQATVPRPPSASSSPPAISGRADLRRLRRSRRS